MLINLRDDILNTMPNCHNITVQSMSIMKSISTTIQFDTMVFLNLGKNCLQVPNDNQVMQKNQGGQCVPHIFFLGL